MITAQLGGLGFRILGLLLPAHVHHVPVSACTATWRGPHSLPVQPVCVLGSHTGDPLQHK